MNKHTTRRALWLSLFASIMMIPIFGAEIKTVVVIPFQSTSMDVAMSKSFTDIEWSHKDTNYLTSEVVNAFVNNPNFKVVERQTNRLSALEEERKFQSMNTDQRLLFGKELGAEYLIYGDIELIEAQERSIRFESSNMSITELTGQMIINMRVVNVLSAEIVASKKIHHNEVVRLNEYSKETTLSFFNKLKEHSVQKLVHEISEAINPVKIASVDHNEIYLNHGKGSFLKPGTIMEVYQPGQLIINPDTHEILGTQEHKVGKIIVRCMMPKFSVAQVLEASAPFEPGYICRKPFDKKIKCPKCLLKPKKMSPLSTDKPVKW